MNILVTAGGTSESIDPVRSITNHATGRLGCLIAERFAQDTVIENVFYVASRSACRPTHEKAQIIPITDTAELEAAVLETIQKHRIDAVVHSMAVSDYRVRSVTTAELLAAELRGRPDSSISAEAILNAEGLNNAEKLSSGEKNLIVLLEPTPKVIALFQHHAPHALLVGFKLLDNVPHDDLIATALALLQKNACTFVLANDGSEIYGDSHVGYLLDRDGQVQQFETKQQISDGIVNAVLTKMKEREQE